MMVALACPALIAHSTKKISFPKILWEYLPDAYSFPDENIKLEFEFDFIKMSK